MADDFDPDAWSQKNGYVAPSQAPGQQQAEPTYEQKVAALQAKMAADKNAGPEVPELPGWLAAPAGAVTANLPGLAGAAGGVGALAAGHTFGEGYRLGTKATNKLASEHPWMNAAGAVAGSVVNPLTKVVGALSLPARALAGTAMGTLQGAGQATNLEELKHNARMGAAVGLGSTLLGAGLGKGAEYIGGKLGGARSKLIDYFAGKGEEAIANNPELSVLGSDVNAIGEAGPKSVPELGTSQWLRTPEEKELARTAAKAVPILQRTRPQAAIVQTMGPEYVNEVIGNKVSNAIADRSASQPLYKALTRIGKLGGADISGDQLSQNIQRTMAAKQLGPQSPLSSLFESATGEDLGESARRVANTADENLFHSPGAYDKGAQQMQNGAKGYLDRLEQGMANRHGGGYVPKPMASAGKATVPNGPANVTAPVDMGIPVPEAGIPMQPHSTFLGAGQPSSKIRYSQYSPSEAADIGGAAERTNAINIGRGQAGSIAQMLKKVGANPITGAIPGVGGAARIAGAMGPGTAEVGAGLIGKLGNGVSAVGRAAGNNTLHQAIRASAVSSSLGHYEDPAQTTKDFLSAHLPKNPNEEELR